MEGIGPGLGYHFDLASAELAVLGIKATGENSEFGDRIQVGNDGRAHVDVFLDVASVQHKAIGEFALAVDRDGAGVQIAGRRKCARAHVLDRIGSDGRDRNDAGLKREQVRKAAAIERHGCHLFGRDDFAHLRISGVDMGGQFGDGDRFSPLADG